MTQFRQSILLGYIENRLKYESNKSRKQKVKSSENTPMNQDAGAASSPDMEAIINSMKSIVITSEEDMEIIRANLEKSRDYRRSLLAKPSIDLMETFPFFFICPQLVSKSMEKYEKFCFGISFLDFSCIDCLRVREAIS